MSELTEQRWAVFSERGRESLGLTYAQALETMRALAQEKVSGVSIITDDAARRAADGAKPPARRSNPNGAKARVKR
jgi:hypothetical protein